MMHEQIAQEENCIAGELRGRLCAGGAGHAREDGHAQEERREAQEEKGHQQWKKP